MNTINALSLRHCLFHRLTVSVSSDRKVNRNIYPDTVTRDRVHLSLSRVTASRYIFRLTFRSLSDVLYSDECRTKKAFSMSK